MTNTDRLQGSDGWTFSSTSTLGGDRVLTRHVDHSTHVRRVQSLVHDWNPQWGTKAAWQDAIDWALMADLDGLVTTLATVYAPRLGRPATDPVALLRSLSLMNLLQEASITRFVRRLHQSPVLSYLCGFPGPDAVPAVSTFYAFLSRLYPEPVRRKGCMRRSSGRRLKLKSGEKMPTRRPGAIGRVARRVLREAHKPPRTRASAVWDRLLALVTLESVRKDVLPSRWDLAVDSTPVQSGAHSFGKKTCDCPSRRCDCLRYFSDPMALLGWDSHRHRYYFGYSPQAMVVANPGPDGKSHPLIVSLALHPANRHDGAAYPDLLVKTQQLYAGAGPILDRVIGDAAFDVSDLWEFTKARGLTPVFAPMTEIHPPRLSDAATEAGMHLDPDYRPVCKEGRSLASRGHARPGLKGWACPVRNKKSPPCLTPCAKVNKTVYVNFRGSRYDAIGLPYRSDAWTQVYNQRTGVERAFSLLESSGVKDAHHRRPYLWFGRLALAAIVSHVKAWLRQL